MALQDELTKAFESLAPRVAALYAEAAAEALRNTTVEQLLLLAGTAPRSGSAPKPEPKPTINGTSARKPQTPKTIGSGSLQAVVNLLETNPGLGSEHIRRILNIPKPTWLKLTAEGLDSGALSKKGEKRATKWFAAG